MVKLVKLLALIAVASFMFGTAGCKQEQTPQDQAQDAMDEAQDAAEDTAEDAEDAMDEMMD